MKVPTPSVLLAALVALAPLSAFAAPSRVQTAPDRSWITVSGKVASTAPDSFKLQYGSKSITIEMDDWDWYDESRPLFKGEQVTVTGRVDDDLFERRTIEASSVYAKNYATYYYASSADEENGYYPYGGYSAYGPSNFVWLTGKVRSVSGREFTLDTGVHDVKVHIHGLAENPLDDKGRQQVHVGDRVQVGGTSDWGLFERHEIDASSVTTLSSS